METKLLPMHAIILCAGLSTRFRPFTESLPKPAIPLLNMPLGFHPLLHFSERQISKLIVNLHYRPEPIVDMFTGSNYPWPIHFSHEQGRPLGSGGGLKYAANQLKGSGSFWYINGDEVLMDLPFAELERFQKFHLESNAMMTLLAMPHPEVGKTLKAIITDENSNVVGFGKNIPENQFGYHFPGIMLIREDLLDAIPDGESSIFVDTVMPLIKSGAKINCFSMVLDWFETGDITNYLSANNRLLDIISENLHPDWVNKFQKASPQSELIKTQSAKIWKHKTAIIDDINSVKGFAVLGEGCHIQAPIENSVIAAKQIIDRPLKNNFIL